MFPNRFNGTKTVSNPNPKQTSASAETISNDDGLLTEILLRLPIKSLLVFKSVSKHWLSLISNPYFSRLRTPHSTTTSALFLQQLPSHKNPTSHFLDLNPIPIPNPSLSFLGDYPKIPNPLGIRILQSTNGLLLCSTDRTHTTQESCYYVYNPTTKQYKTVSLPLLNDSDGVCRRYCGFSLAFDPSKSPHYKVVCVRNCDTFPRHYQMVVYSLESGIWRLSGAPFPASNTDSLVLLNSGVFWNGAVLWIGYLFGSLFCFNVGEERMRELPRPQIPHPHTGGLKRVIYFGESRDHWHLVEVCGRTTIQFNVYEMERDCSKWFVKYNVDLHAVQKEFPEKNLDLHYYKFSILCIVRCEIEEDSYLVLHIPAGKFLRYNFKDQSFVELCETSLEIQWIHAYQYIESLSCVL